MSLYARGVWSAWETMTHRIPLDEQQQLQHRKVYVCDSFAGNTATSGDGDQKDQGGNNHSKVSSLRMAQHFYQAGLLENSDEDEDGGGGVVFCQGPIPQTTELVVQKVQSLAVLRLGSEQTYESTKHILLRLYDKVSLGGYVVVDGYWQDTKPNNNHQRLSPAARACQDFFQSLTHNPTLSGDDKIKKKSCRTLYEGLKVITRHLC